MPSVSPRQRVRVMLVDDHETVRQGVRALFRNVTGVEIVHEASDGNAALEAIRTVSPELIVLDLSMPRVEGLTVLRRLGEARRRTKSIVLTRYREAGYIREAFAAGAHGYVLKQSAFSELERAMDAVQKGHRYLDSSFASHVLTTLHPSDEEPAVTERELDVLRRAALGDSNLAVADALEIAVKTVEVHKANAMRKLGLMNRRELVRYAALHGWFADV